MNEQIVDPVVSRLKFDREVNRFIELKDQYLQKGWWLLKAEFPHVLIGFVSPKTQPPVVVFGALIDFANYDLWPPSVRIVNPLTQVPYKNRELPVRFLRTKPIQKAEGNPTNPQEFLQQLNPQELVQAYEADDIPFICLPGIREYHTNPAHSGQSWFLHRGKGEGTLHFIIDQLSRYGLEPVHAMNYRITKLDFQFSGFNMKLST